MQRGTIQVQSKKSIFRRSIKYFKEYCEHTSIHGFKYFSEDRPLFEKLWWLVAITTCAAVCGIMINNIFQKFIQYPVIVTFSMQDTTLYKIPFPAVTICSKARISQGYFNFTKMPTRSADWTPEEQIKLTMSRVVCDTGAFFDINYDKVDPEVNATELYRFLDMSRTEFVAFGTFMGEPSTSVEAFTPILTEDGLCYTFNSLDKEDIFKEGVFSDNEYFRAKKSEDYGVERGFGKNANVDTYPRRALLPGAMNSFQVLLHTLHSDIEYKCSNEERGYKVSLHIPGKIPNMAQQYFIVPHNQIVLGTIIPQVITTSDTVKVYDPDKRDCFFQSEKYLKFFKIYTQANCQLECFTNYTFSKCGCVAYFMPRFPDTPICGVEHDLCQYGSERKFALDTIESNLKRDKGLSDTDHFSCNCLPMCTDISYNLEISQNPWPWQESYKHIFEINDTFAEEEEDLKMHLSQLSLFFKTNHIETKERHAVYGFTDFLSNFGGLLGLFTGFSILSFVEIIYFFSLRLIVNIKKFKAGMVKNQHKQ